MKNSSNERQDMALSGESLRLAFTRKLARQRRRRAMLVATRVLTQTAVTPCLRARKAVPATFECTLQAGTMGNIIGRSFYSMCHQPGKELALPFSAKSFSCFIHLAVPVGDDALRNLAMDLLQKGLYSVYCSGVECTRLGEIFDDILDNGQHFHGQDAVTAMVFEDESPADAMEYFALPTGLEAPHMVMTVGTAEQHAVTLTYFATAVERTKSAYCS